MDREKFYSYLKEIVKSGDRVLDVGCGSGDFLKRLTREVHIKGVGVDPYALEEKGENYHILALPAEQIDALNTRFDLVYTFHSLHHFSDPLKFLKNVKVVLKPNGYLVIADWIYGTDTGVPERYYKLEEVEEMLAKMGFKIDEEFVVDKDTFVFKSHARSESRDGRDRSD